MTSVSFKGFPMGSRVSIDGVMTTSWGRASIWDQTPSAGTSVRINVARSNLRVAPEGMNFDLTLSGFDNNTPANPENPDPSFTNYVFWDYGDSYTFTAPEQVQTANMDSRYSRGPLGSHTYRAAGNYVVRVCVIEPSSGKIGIGTLNIGGASADTPAVGDPDTLYTGAATLFVSTNSDFTNKPAGAAEYTSVQSAVSAMISATAPRRVMLERGQTHTATGVFSNRSYGTVTADALSFRIEARPGGGAKPIFTTTHTGLQINDSVRNGSNPTINSDFIISGIDARGPWDSTTETGNAIDFALVGSNGSTYSCVDACEFDGWGIALYFFTTDSTARSIINDTIITNWQNYGYYEASAQSFLAVTGCRIAQHVDALGGGPRNAPKLYNHHGPIRCGRTPKALFWASDLFSNTGWFQQASIFDPQPALRVVSEPRKGARFNVGACVLESGGVPLAIANSAASLDQPVNGLVDGNLLLGGWRSGQFISMQYGGCTIRNNFLVKANVQRNGSAVGGPSRYVSQGFIHFSRSGFGSATDNQTTPTLIYNNSFINLMNAANDPDGDGATAIISIGSNGSGFVRTVENNILHEPNRGTPNTPYAPLTSVFAFTPRYKGYRDYNQPTLNTTFATPADSGRIWLPQVGSPALGNALPEPNAAVDFSGGKRPEPPSIGATEAG